MRTNRVGVLGNYYGGMLDVYSDLTQQSAVFGNHFEMLEMCELFEFRKSVTKQELEDKINEFGNKFNVSEECDHSEIERAAKTSVALDKLINEHKLGSLAYYYEGSGEYEDIVTSLIAGNTLLTGRNVPSAGECEIKNVQAMKIMDLFGAGGSFSEFYLFVSDKKLKNRGSSQLKHIKISLSKKFKNNIFNETFLDKDNLIHYY